MVTTLFNPIFHVGSSPWLTKATPDDVKASLPSIVCAIFSHRDFCPPEPNFGFLYHKGQSTTEQMNNCHPSMPVPVYCVVYSKHNDCSVSDVRPRKKYAWPHLGLSWHRRIRCQQSRPVVGQRGTGVGWTRDTLHLPSFVLLVGHKAFHWWSRLVNIKSWVRLGTKQTQESFHTSIRLNFREPPKFSYPPWLNNGSKWALVEIKWRLTGEGKNPLCELESCNF